MNSALGSSWHINVRSFEDAVVEHICSFCPCRSLSEYQLLRYRLLDLDLDLEPLLLDRKQRKPIIQNLGMRGIQLDLYAVTLPA